MLSHLVERVVIAPELLDGTVEVASKHLDGPGVDRGERCLELPPELYEDRAALPVQGTGLFEVAAHRFEVGDRAQDQRLGLPVPTRLFEERPRAGDRLRDGRRSIQGTGHECGDEARLDDAIPGATCVLDHPLGR